MGIQPVILCGGTGTRLWPLSRRLLPKQFLPLVTERTLLQDTVLRIADLPGVERPIVISNNDHRFLVAEQLNELGVKPAVQILEPVGRNTAPAVAVAALHARRYLGELAAFRRDILECAEKALKAAGRDLGFLRLDAAAFNACPAESVDYAVMEKTSRGAVVRADIGWSDVGSWSALWDIGKKDAAQNATRGDVHLADASGCYIWGDSRLVVALGAKDLIIVETDDAVLVAERARAEEVKDIVARLDKAARSEHVSHSRVYRPWGYYERSEERRVGKESRGR